MNIQKTLFVLPLIGALLLASCEGKKKNEAADATLETEKYACPMDPDVTGKKGDVCSKCNMKLMPVRNKANEYTMKFSAQPEVEAGKASILSFTPKIKGKENETVSLQLQHEKKIHLIIVSKDLSYFDHVHPMAQADSSYRIDVLPKETSYSNGKFQNETHFDAGGEYVLFADYLPSGAEHQLERIELKVKGKENSTVHFTQPKLVSPVNDYEVILQPKSELVTGETMHIAGIFKQKGKEISADQLEDYLSAKAHVVIISEDTQHYLHVHPNVDNGRLDLHTYFENPGIYRTWLQFKAKGVVYTTDFVLLVKAGTENKSQEKHHH